MTPHIIGANQAALTAESHPRFFRTERGYAGRFYCALTSVFDQMNLFEDDRILELEYQKTALHGMWQRPDVISHIPHQVTHAPVQENNYAVWAFKLRACPGQAWADFEKLDEMIGRLAYPLAFFVNIGADRHLLEQYEGPFADRIYGTGVWLQDGGVNIRFDRCSDVLA